MEHRFELQIHPQPDDTTCGPTCLHAVYHYYGDEMPLGQVVGEVHQLEEGGTLSVLLACHALARGYQATIYTYNLQLFDPSWGPLGRDDLRRRLEAQARLKEHPKLRRATAAYLEFLDRGGELRFDELSGRLLRELLDRSLPLLTGLSATYLYQSIRERPGDGQEDDLGGEPVGHFVVLCGYDRASRRVLVADPLHGRRPGEEPIYPVGLDRLIGAIFLGILTYDANLLIIEPKPPRG